MSSTPTGTATPSILAISADEAAARGRRRGRRSRRAPRPSARVPLDDLVGDPGRARAGRRRDPASGAHTERPPSRRGGAQVVPHRWLPSRPHGTGLKGEVSRRRIPRRGRTAQRRDRPGRPTEPGRRLVGQPNGRSGSRCRTGMDRRSPWPSIFGASKLPEIARNVGDAAGEFKKGLKEGNETRGRRAPRHAAGARPAPADAPAGLAPRGRRAPARGEPRRPRVLGARRAASRSRSCRGSRSRTAARSSADSSVAASTASLIATAAGRRARWRSSSTATRRIVRSSAAIRATVQPSVCSSRSRSISGRCSLHALRRAPRRTAGRHGRPRPTPRARRRDPRR